MWVGDDAEPVGGTRARRERNAKQTQVNSQDGAVRAGISIPDNLSGISSWLRFFGRHLRANPLQVAALAVLLPIDILRQLLTPEVLRRFIDSSMSSAPPVEVWRLVGVYVALAVAGQLTAVLLVYVTTRFAWRSTNSLRVDLVIHCLRQDPEFFQRIPPGELVERIDGDATRLAGVMSGLLLEALAQSLLAIGIVAALFRLDWRFGLLYAPFVLAMVAVLRYQTGRAVPYVAAQRQAEAGILGFLAERINGAEDISANGATRYIRRSLWFLLGVEYGKSRRAARAGARWPATVQALSVLSILLALALGAWLYDAGQTTVGTVFAALSYATLIRFPLTQVAGRMQELEDSVVSLQRLGRLLRERSAVPDGAGTLPADPADVRFEDVSFGYDDSGLVLRGVSFHLPAGQVLGVVGRTGSGKSTLIGLVFRRFDPTGGAVRINGQDLRALDRASLRGRITYIPQSTHIFAASLRDNLALFDTGVPDARLEQALHEVGLGDWVRGLPAGLDTMLDETDTGLSVGQGQLLNLARAFVTDPAVVLLDEPSSQIDPHTERTLRRAMARFLRGRTAVIVSHRLDTLREVDRILVMDAGRVVECAPRDALLADPDSAFARMVSAGVTP